MFIDLGGIDGLVHKSELSWNKVNNPEAGYKVGEEVEAEVIDINHERGRISLSIRRLQPDPWHSTVADYTVGDIIEGTVTKLVNFGAFVRVRDGLEGLIHISELSHQRVAHPGDVVHEGQTLKLKIISLDSERHRLGLSLKQAEEAPARPEPPVAAPRPERAERRPRPERGYSMSDAIQEPEGGIDNTLAAAFAQVRDQLAASERAAGGPEDEAPSAEAEEPPTAAVAEAAVADVPRADGSAAADRRSMMTAEAAEAAAEVGSTESAEADEVTEAPPRPRQRLPPRCRRRPRRMPRPKPQPRPRPRRRPRPNLRPRRRLRPRPRPRRRPPAKAEAKTETRCKADAPAKTDAKADAPAKTEAKADAPAKTEAKADAPAKAEAKAEAGEGRACRGGRRGIGRGSHRGSRRHRGLTAIGRTGGRPTGPGLASSSPAAAGACPTTAGSALRRWLQWRDGVVLSAGLRRGVVVLAWPRSRPPWRPKGNRRSTRWIDSTSSQTALARS